MNANPSTRPVGKLLIVDDCARMRKVIRSTVADLVRETIEADDGGAAVEAYFQHKPDWVTMDVTMHPVDGLTALRRIRARDPLARIVIVTVHETKAFSDAARLAGASGFVLKDDLGNIRDLISPADAVPADADAGK